MSKWYKVQLGDKSQVVDADKAMQVAGEMVQANGGGVPKIDECDEHGNLLAKQDEVVTKITPVVSNPVVRNNPIPPVAPVYSQWGNTVVDQDAAKRIQGLHDKIGAGGIKVDATQQFFATGTRMAEEGYATQNKRQREHLKMQPLREAINDLSEKVGNELRRDIHVSAKEIADAIDVDDNKVYVKDHLLTERAIRGIMARLESPALGYILGLQDRINSEMVKSDANHSLIEKDAGKLADILHHECKRFADTAFKLRMREYPCDIYAATSPTFGVADAPMVMEQILDQMPTDARGSWAYDPDTTTWELRASIWTPVPVAEQAVGEPFEGYVSFSSRDNGTGRFNGGGGINILRCLNASTYSAGEGVSRVHRGKIMYDIDVMVRNSLKAINVLCDAWGKARKNKVEVPTGVPIEQAIPGFWRALLKEGELSKVLVGRKENHVTGLTRAYFNERRDNADVVMADFGQGWTRYIQGQSTEIRREGEQAIGAWMVKPGKMRCDLKEKE